MRTVLRAIAAAYFYCGVALGFIMWFSYMWALGWGAPAHVSFIEQSKAIFVSQPLIVAYSAVRVVTWDPALALWIAVPNSYSFGEWIAPGFYTEWPS